MSDQPTYLVDAELLVVDPEGIPRSTLALGDSGSTSIGRAGRPRHSLTPHETP